MANGGRQHGRVQQRRTGERSRDGDAATASDDGPHTRATRRSNARGTRCRRYTARTTPYTRTTHLNTVDRRNLGGEHCAHGQARQEHHRGSDGAGNGCARWTAGRTTTKVGTTEGWLGPLLLETTRSTKEIISTSNCQPGASGVHDVVSLLLRLTARPLTNTLSHASICCERHEISRLRRRNGGLLPQTVTAVSNAAS